MNQTNQLSIRRAELADAEPLVELASRIYRKWGFARVGEHIFQMGDDAQTDFWMMRPL